jgi:hypothetical protein
MVDDYGNDNFFDDPNPDWFCKSCGQLFDEDDLNEDGFCPDCAEFEAEYDNDDDEEEKDDGW